MDVLSLERTLEQGIWLDKVGRGENVEVDAYLCSRDDNIQDSPTTLLQVLIRTSIHA